MVIGNSLIRQVPEALAGLRLDQALAELMPDYSRSRLCAWIRAGRVSVDGAVLRPKDRVMGGEQVVVNAEPEPAVQFQPQAIPLDIVYEDHALLIINKPAGLVVHPAAGNPDGTLQNALLHHHEALATLPRAGIVHRLDKDTTGLLMIAKTLTAHKCLVEQLQARTITREYLALVQGAMTAGGSIDEPIGRHPVDRKRYAVRENGKPARTHYRVLERFPAHTLVRVVLETGRTHQIRVHMAFIRYPLLGDPVYGGRFRAPAGWNDAALEKLRGFQRQALHAAKLGLRHPDTGDYMEWVMDLPDDMRQLLELLRAP